MFVITSSTKSEIEKMNKELKLLSKVRTALIGSSIAKELCEENGYKKSILSGVPIDFKKDLDVSARTENARIFLSSKLSDKSFDIIMRYVIHELTHVFHHLKNESDREKSKDYLDRETEIEAFQYQIEYDSKKRSKQKAKDYAEGLLEFHKIPEKEREDKLEELLEKVE